MAGKDGTGRAGRRDDGQDRRAAGSRRGHLSDPVPAENCVRAVQAAC
jgi:hypothetical protein